MPAARRTTVAREPRHPPWCRHHEDPWGSIMMIDPQDHIQARARDDTAPDPGERASGTHKSVGRSFQFMPSTATYLLSTGVWTMGPRMRLCWITDNVNTFQRDRRKKDRIFIWEI